MKANARIFSSCNFLACALVAGAAALAAPPEEDPQDNGYRCDVRWVALTDADGKGVRFTGSKPLFVQASHYLWEDLYFARHQLGDERRRAPLVPHDATFLNLDLRQSGFGDFNKNVLPLDKYRFDAKRETWTVELAPEK